MERKTSPQNHEHTLPYENKLCKCHIKKRSKRALVKKSLMFTGISKHLHKTVHFKKSHTLFLNFFVGLMSFLNRYLQKTAGLFI